MLWVSYVRQQSRILRPMPSSISSSLQSGEWCPSRRAWRQWDSDLSKLGLLLKGRGMRWVEGASVLAQSRVRDCERCLTLSAFSTLVLVASSQIIAVIQAEFFYRLFLHHITFFFFFNKFQQKEIIRFQEKGWWRTGGFASAHFLHSVFWTAVYPLWFGDRYWSLAVKCLSLFSWDSPCFSQVANWAKNCHFHTRSRILHLLFVHFVGGITNFQKSLSYKTKQKTFPQKNIDNLILTLFWTKTYQLK